MIKLRPPKMELPKTASDDLRIGHLLGRSCSADTADVLIVGFPSDEGVRINGGRPGASEGPQSIRNRLYRMTPDARHSAEFESLLRRSFDLGDVDASGDVERDQEYLGEILASHLDRGAVPIILGGGHETAFGHFLGYVAAAQQVEIVNWDAHPDVRPLNDGRAHSGSPFRQALTHESESCRRYSVFGLSPHSAAAAHLEFIRDRGGRIRWSDELMSQDVRGVYGDAEHPVMVTFDLDAVDQSEAPGVSAPCVAGLSSKLWLQAAFEGGRCPGTSSFDVVELNPRFDVDGRTARLAAMTVWMILRGLAERISKE